ncbi:hypothetical protein [uncultured Legionella sp.]|uniref:hypothetical protein n=1 Tax=uncultured Legionella sp. TaxID=210934 RepID=UPI0026200524|nr:hypothetical protein [uncultured Legionella sp.]
MLNSTLYATTEVWTYSVPSPASVTLTDGEIATVHYTVTNKSHRSKNLILNAEGISASRQEKAAPAL